MLAQEAYTVGCLYFKGIEKEQSMRISSLREGKRMLFQTYLKVRIRPVCSQA